MSLAKALATAAPYYNLGLVIVAIFLFVRLFNTPAKYRETYLFPWKLIFGALLIFIIEEILTILRAIGVINIPVHINGFFELGIIALFIYALLLQKEHIQKYYLSKPRKRRTVKILKKSVRKKAVKKRSIKRSSSSKRRTVKKNR